VSSLLLKLCAASLLLSAPAVPAQDCGLPVQSRKVDEYGNIPAAEEESRLDKLAAALKAEHEDTVAFIVAYAGRGGRAGDAFKRADRAKQVLVEKSVFFNSRLNTLDCGRREVASTEFWLTPAGASPPRCSPTLDPPPAPAKGAVRRPPPRRRSGRL
jgi:hypothetical protein